MPFGRENNQPAIASSASAAQPEISTDRRIVIVIPSNVDDEFAPLKEILSGGGRRRVVVVPIDSGNLITPDDFRSAEWLVLGVGRAPGCELEVLNTAALALVENLAFVFLDPEPGHDADYGKADVVVFRSPLQHAQLASRYGRAHTLAYEDIGTSAAQIAKAIDSAG